MRAAVQLAIPNLSHITAHMENHTCMAHGGKQSRLLDTSWTHSWHMVCFGEKALALAALPWASELLKDLSKHILLGSATWVSDHRRSSDVAREFVILSSSKMVKNPSAIQETWVLSLGWEDPLEKGTGYPLQYSCLENPMDRGAWWATVHGSTKSWTRLSDFYLPFHQVLPWCWPAGPGTALWERLPRSPGFLQRSLRSICKFKPCGCSILVNPHNEFSLSGLRLKREPTFRG